VLLAQMTANIIDNAIRHNHPGGWVTTLAQPFRRLGTDRTGSATGTGLGLADAIAAAHRGTLHLHARPNGGLRAVIDLPPASSSPPAQLATSGAAQ
jgi:hypothetical protein